jgi:hypothetical protein
MIINTTIGTGGSMYQINRSAIQKKCNIRYGSMTHDIVTLNANVNVIQHLYAMLTFADSAINVAISHIGG